MFGFSQLFREEDANDDDPQSGTPPGGGTVYANDKLPPPPRLASGLSGIYNQGATCYMNSLLQTLLMTPEFRESLFQLDAKQLGSLEDKDKKGAKVRVIPIQLQRLFGRMLLLNAQGVATTDLTDSFGWTNSEELVQQDVQELNRILFSAIEDSLVGTTGGDLIRKLYHGTTVNQITCQKCGRVSEREEDFLDLCVAVSGSQGLEHSLAQSYVETEDLSGKNQYKCEACNKLVDAKKGAKLRHLPQILTVSLLRFSFDFQKMERYKETGKFIFPMQLDMAPYVDKLSTAGCTEYELFSIVVHSGGAHGGHYTAYIRDIDALGNWSHPDQDDIQLAPDPASGRMDFIECDSPVQLIQTILGKNPQGRMKVDTLCSEVMKQTGVSWNKRFKKQHGPINKFLRRYNDKFDVNDENWVSLKEAKAEKVGEQNETSTGDNKNMDTAAKNKAPKRPLSPPPADGQAWFHFNDCRVYPARTKEIENQYSGKSSAYMLFYRSKALQRPIVARRNSEYMMAPELLQMIMEENNKLDQDRLNYEIQMNTITLKLLFPSFYTYKNGALKANDDTFSFMEISTDKRKTIPQLIEAIKEMYGELCPEDLVISTAKLHPAGIHIYDTISGHVSLLQGATKTTMKDMNLSDQTRLFVWDGRQIGGHNVLTGVENEPVELTVTYGNPSQLTHAFPKGLTIGELRVMLSELTGLDLELIALNRIITEGKDTRLQKVFPEDHGKTIAEYGIQNGEQFILDNIKNDTSSNTVQETVVNQSRKVSFAVQNRCQATSSEDWSLLPVEVDRDATVEELKMTIQSILSGECVFDMNCRLRIDHDDLGLMPPLHEGLDLESAGLKQGMRLVLEPGPAPLSDQFTLIILSGKGKGEPPAIEVIVERNKTVYETTRLVIRKVGKTGDDWHLRKTNWCGEAAAVLDELEATLAECQLKDGDRLMLEEGKLPPKGYLKLSIHLYSTLHRDKHEKGSTASGIVSSILGGLQGLLGQSSENNQNSPVSLGEVIVSKETLLGELKALVMDLPGMQQITVPTVKFLRLRFVEQRSLGTVLKDHSQTLQRLKLVSGSTLGVQVLTEEENLSTNHLLLTVRHRKAGTRSYHSPRELIWEVSQGASYASLRRSVGELLGIPSDRLMLAKYIPDKYEWFEIREIAKVQPGKGQSPVPQGKKKSNQAKQNLRHAPYHIKDGDIIGVKDMESDPQNKDDFLTKADIKGQERLRTEAEERRKKREELRRANAALSLGSPAPRPEVGIKIHVDNFS